MVLMFVLSLKHAKLPRFSISDVDRKDHNVFVNLLKTKPIEISEFYFPYDLCVISSSFGRMYT